MTRMFSLTFNWCLICIFINNCLCDIYLHNPRGSNNRLNEQSATRAQNNRLFDSQNNARGGYNVGDKSDVPSGNNENAQYQMKYFQSGKYPSTDPSELVIEWTMQHGCGAHEHDNPNKLNCQLVLQFTCCDKEGGCDATGDNLKDGTVTLRSQFTRGSKRETVEETKRRRQKDVNANKNRGRQESWDFYNECRIREANNGLFLADQKRQQNSAAFTRQNPNGNRNGLECPEERDYYPYWHPSPWVDIAVLTSNASHCEYYKKESGNRKPKGKCFESNRAASSNNNEEDCVDARGTWKEVWSYLEKAPDATSKSECERVPDRVWGTPWDAATSSSEECLVLAPRLDCHEVPHTRSNHLGNTPEDARAPNYTWILPHFPSLTTKRCAFRIRYNISTDDYDSFSTDSQSNGKESPVKNNPEVDINAKNQKLKLAINTAQYGRTFQDRSHVFELKPRPDGVARGSRIINLNVRGKRGNIVQVYPGVEYDFIPKDLRMSQRDLVHVQWTGSNSHNNGKPQGDGQQGDDGQGRAGTDRSNLVQIPDVLANFPLAFEGSSLFDDARVVWSSTGSRDMSAKDLAVCLATSGYYSSVADVKKKTKMNPLLDNAPASFEGVILRFSKPRSYVYMSTRNNNFSNRSQKGKIVVS